MGVSYISPSHLVHSVAHGVMWGKDDKNNEDSAQSHLPVRHKTQTLLNIDVRWKLPEGSVAVRSHSEGASVVTDATRPWQENATISLALPLLAPLAATAEELRSECWVGGRPRSASEAPVICQTPLEIGHLHHLLLPCVPWL